MTNAAASGMDNAGGGVTLFGVTFGSKILGIVIGVAGVAIAGYVGASFVLPIWDELQVSQQTITTKEANVAKLQRDAAEKANIGQKIEQATQENKYILSLLPTVDNVDTLIRDIQEQIPKTIKISLPPDFTYELAGSLRTFQPLPVELKTQYKIYSFNIGFDGRFEDIKNTIEKIERLRPLLIVENLRLTVKALPVEKFTFSRPIIEGKEKEILDSLPPLIGADFTLKAFVPLSDEELAAAAAATAPQPAQ